MQVLPMRVGPFAFTYQGSGANYRLFVPKTFRSQERKVPMENFRSPGTKVPGNFRSRDLSFPENESSWDLSYPGTFVPIKVYAGL